MSTYTLNGVDLATFGWTPGRQSGSNIALSGFLDMPVRLGKTYHSWGDSKGVQPYVSASEIRFGGRDLQLVGFIRGVDRVDCLSKANSMRDVVETYSGLVPLVSTWGTYQVQVKSIPMQFIHSTTIQVTINMREPVVDMTGTIPTVDNGDYGIDDISFSALGVDVIALGGDRVGMPNVKPGIFTAWETEGYQIKPSEAPVLDLSMLVQAPDYATALDRIQGLYALLSAPGTRMLHVKNDTYREVFVVDGFRVSDMRSLPSSFTCRLDLKVIQASDEWYLLSDNAGDYITDNSFNKILVYGK